MPLVNNRGELPPTAGLPLVFSDLYRKPQQSFGQGLQDWLGLPAPLFTCSGTAALITALTALRHRFPARKKVVFPAYTCPLVALALHFVQGTECVVCDLLPQSIDMDPQHLRNLCDDTTLAVVVTHLGGRVADTATATGIAHACGAMVIEDAAQALGAREGNMSVGLTGDIGFFSLAVGKGLTTYEGGILFSRDPDLHALLEQTTHELLPQNRWWDAKRLAELLGYFLLYTPAGLRLVYGRPLRRALGKGNEIAAVGDYFTPADVPLHSLDSYRLRIAGNAFSRLPAFLEQGRQRAQNRLAALGCDVAWTILDDATGKTGVWPFFMVLLQSRAHRDAALQRLWQRGWGVSKLFIHPLAEYPFLASRVGRQAACPQAHAFAERMLTVTNSPWLDDAAFYAVMEEIRACAF